MQRIKFFSLITCPFLLLIYSQAFPAAYEASTLHNAISRSETVQDLFFSRWETIQDKEQYLDWYGKINWVNDFKINAINSATGEKKAVPMMLIRSYGSITFTYPVLGGYEGASWKERLAGKRKEKTEEAENGEGTLGLWKPKNLVLGITATGFHYGLKRTAKIDRGSAGSASGTDYKYSQFFDDIFAASVMYRPYFHMHFGVVLNNQIEPKDNGTMNYGSSSNRKLRYFMGSNILSFLNVNATTTSQSLESIALGLKINTIAGIFVKDMSPLIPELTITYKLMNIFKDQPYDPVWVNSRYDTDGNLKSSMTRDSMKKKASLNTLSFLVKENLFDYVLIEFYTELQKQSGKLIEKRTGQKIEFNPLREMYLSAGYNFLHSSAKEGYSLTASIGGSTYWDVAVPVHRKSGSKYYLDGGFFGINLAAPLAGAEFKLVYNYAPELKKLIETADKLAIEGSIYICF